LTARDLPVARAQIVDALERGDRETAAATVEANLRDALRGLLERLDTTA
jgi:DNA-binding GntR family transcriptional regulator